MGDGEIGLRSLSPLAGIAAAALAYPAGTALARRSVSGTQRALRHLPAVA